MNSQPLHRILRALALTQERELTCAELDEALLARFVELELAGEAPEAEMPHVHHHLTLCPDCRREYEELLDVLRLERAGAWEEPTATPTFDLSFLGTSAEVRRGASAEVRRAWTQLGPRLRRYAERIAVARLGDLARRGQLPPGLQLQYAPAPRLRGPETEVSPTAFRLTDAEANLQLEVEVRPVGDATVWITVHATDLEAQQPLLGTRVSLCAEDGTPLEMRTIRRDETVQFKEVATERTYLLRVQHGRKVWEVPVDFAHPNS